jgi:hypothetical protein
MLRWWTAREKKVGRQDGDRERGETGQREVGLDIKKRREPRLGFC